MSGERELPDTWETREAQETRETRETREAREAREAQETLPSDLRDDEPHYEIHPVAGGLLRVRWGGRERHVSPLPSLPGADALFTGYEDLCAPCGTEHERLERQRAAVRSVADRPHRYATAAAALLTPRPPGIPGAPFPEPAARLRELDTVTSLLPWGVRARLAATTSDEPLRGAYFTPDAYAPGAEPDDTVAGSYLSALVRHLEEAATETERLERVDFLTRGLREFREPIDPGNPHTAPAARALLEQVLRQWRERPYIRLLAALGRRPDTVREEVDALLGDGGHAAHTDGRATAEALVDVVKDHFADRPGGLWEAVPPLLCLAGIDDRLDGQLEKAVRALPADAAPVRVREVAPLSAGVRLEAVLRLLTRVGTGAPHHPGPAAPLPGPLLDVLAAAFRAEASTVLPPLIEDMERELGEIERRTAERMLTRHALGLPRSTRPVDRAPLPEDGGTET
ncbi:hypothetical protein [Streptomyces sp. SD15]